MRRFIAIFFLLFSLNASLQASELKDYGPVAEFAGIDSWINSKPLTKDSLKGKVVLVDFWTYTCVNCIRTLPHLKEWYQKYKNKGFVIVGVHSPEFDFEKNPANVKQAVSKLQIPYPIALDNKMATWEAYQNNAWPAHYFIDAKGHIRHVHLGEGSYEESEAVIQALLAEASQKPESQSTTQPSTLPTTQPMRDAKGDVDFSQIQSPETYLGFSRRERLVTSGRPLNLNEWNFEGKWRTEGERILLTESTGKIRFHFSAPKVNLVIHPGPVVGKAIVRLDGKTVNTFEINEPRMYELINLGPKGEEHIIEIEFLTPGVSAYAFTFG